MSDQEFNPDWISPPWNTISDAIEEKGVPEEVYINMLGLTQTGLEKLKRGDMPITSLFASKLSGAIGPTKEFWLNREINYRYGRNRIDAEAMAQVQAENEKYRRGVQENCQLRKDILELEAKVKWFETQFKPPIASPSKAWMDRETGQGSEIDKSELERGGNYNFKNQPEKLKYIGKKGCWHQFEKIGVRGVWCEVLDEDLHMIVKTDQP